MMCNLEIRIIANDDVKIVHCYSQEGHGLGHTFDIGLVPRDLEELCIVLPISMPDDQRDFIVRWGETE